eukprot:scaffold23809_cov62-Cyclotella_meneghiniana.AAC.4
MKLFIFLNIFTAISAQRLQPPAPPAKLITAAAPKAFADVVSSINVNDGSQPTQASKVRDYLSEQSYPLYKRIEFPSNDLQRLSYLLTPSTTFTITSIGVRSYGSFTWFYREFTCLSYGKGFRGGRVRGNLIVFRLLFYAGGTVKQIKSNFKCNQLHNIQTPHQLSLHASSIR